MVRGSDESVVDGDEKLRVVKGDGSDDGWWRMVMRCALDSDESVESDRR